MSRMPSRWRGQGRKQMAGFASAYVALTRMKQHVRFAPTAGKTGPQKRHGSLRRRAAVEPGQPHRQAGVGRPHPPAPDTGTCELPLPAEVLAQRASEYAQRQALEKQAVQTAREMTGEGRDTDAQAGKARGLNGQKAPDRHIALPDDPLTRRQEMAVQQVVSEHFQRERLQQTEREMVRDLQREKVFGVD